MNEDTRRKLDILKKRQYTSVKTPSAQNNKYKQFSILFIVWLYDLWVDFCTIVYKCKMWLLCEVLRFQWNLWSRQNTTRVILATIDDIDVTSLVTAYYNYDRIQSVDSMTVWLERFIKEYHCIYELTPQDQYFGEYNSHSTNLI